MKKNRQKDVKGDARVNFVDQNPVRAQDLASCSGTEAVEKSSSVPNVRMLS
jgi:hypothetical protein